MGDVSGGTARTVNAARKFKTPYLVVDLSKNHDPVSVIEWAKANKIKVLNVAGSRESKAPGIYDRAIEFLRIVILTIKGGDLNEIIKSAGSDEKGKEKKLNGENRDR